MARPRPRLLPRHWHCHVIAALCVIVACAGWPGPARAQAQAQARDNVDDDQTFATWLLTGIDLTQDRWRCSVRLGHLGDLDRAIVIGEAGWLATPALLLQAGYVHLDPLADGAAGTSLLRAGGTWMPVRRGVTLDSRVFLERRSSRGTPAVRRGRDRVRLSWALPQLPKLSVVGSAELIAATGDGLVETRLQAGGVFAVRRLAIESYALQRRLRNRDPVNGLGITVTYRIGR